MLLGPTLSSDWAGAESPRAGGDAQQAWTLTGSVEFGPGARAD